MQGSGGHALGTTSTELCGGLKAQGSGAAEGAAPASGRTAGPSIGGCTSASALHQGCLLSCHPDCSSSPEQQPPQQHQQPERLQEASSQGRFACAAAAAATTSGDSPPSPTAVNPTAAPAHSKQSRPPTPSARGAGSAHPGSSVCSNNNTRRTWNKFQEALYHQAMDPHR